MDYYFQIKRKQTNLRGTICSFNLSFQFLPQDLKNKYGLTDISEVLEGNIGALGFT